MVRLRRIWSINVGISFVEFYCCCFVVFVVVVFVVVVVVVVVRFSVV